MFQLPNQRGPSTDRPVAVLLHLAGSVGEEETPKERALSVEKDGCWWLPTWARETAGPICAGDAQRQACLAGRCRRRLGRGAMHGVRKQGATGESA